MPSGGEGTEMNVYPKALQSEEILRAYSLTRTQHALDSDYSQGPLEKNLTAFENGQKTMAYPSSAEPRYGGK